MKITKGMVAVITGAGGGIGRCVARALADKGCDLALVDLDLMALEESHAAVSEFGTKVTCHVVDIADNKAVEAMSKEVLEQHGKVNILDNNAGITIQKSFETHTFADWDRVIGINLMGVIYGCKAFLPALKEAAKGEGAHIVNMSSMAGFLGLPNQSTYSLTKAAVTILSETLYAELHKDNIGMTSVHPGMIKTKMILATLNESDDIESAEKNYKIVEKMGIPPEYAAERIVKAIEKGRTRIRIGKDAVTLDLLKRFIPNTMIRCLPKLAVKLAAKKA